MTERRAPFTALMTSYFISMLGTSMSQLAIPWMVLTTTGSASKTGLVAFAEMGPYVMAQALAGPLVDRFGLRRSFVVGNVDRRRSRSARFRRCTRCITCRSAY